MTTLRERLAARGLSADQAIVRAPSDVLRAGDALRPDRAAAQAGVAAGSRVALSFHSPLAFIRDLIALDGVAARLLLLAPTLPRASVEALMAQAEVAELRTDRDDLGLAPPGAPSPDGAAGSAPGAGGETQWLMTTSGTTGLPKIAAHTLASLTRSVRPARASSADLPRWGLLYEPSRFAGLQVVLQALVGGGTLLAPEYREPVTERLAYFAAEGCTHLSGTPSLWRKLLMLPEADGLRLEQITLGGEIANDSVLAALRSRFPGANVTHIYASTEVGVAFSVKDGRAGFPRDYLDNPPPQVRLKVVDDVLWIRPEAASATAAPKHVDVDPDGYISTSDRVRIDGDRVFFLGRDSSTVNIGGTKVQLEDVERVILDHPAVADCQCEAKANPIMGALIALTVVPKDPAADKQQFRAEIVKWCKTALPREAQPATVKVAETISVNAAGKVSRSVNS